MPLHAGMLRLQTGGDGEVVDLTAGVLRVLAGAGASVGTVTVFAVGSTVAVTTMEYERGGVRDLQETLERLVPREGEREYAHNRLNHDSNAHAHLRAAFIGPSETIPVVDGRPVLGTWQQVVLIDFDDRPRRRVVHVHVAW